MLRKAVLYLVVLFTLPATSACVHPSLENQKPMPPDFTKWEKTSDYTSVFLYRGKETRIRADKYSKYIVNNARTEISMVLDMVTEFYDPETSKPWFAIYYHVLIKGEATKEEVYLYEPRKGGSWKFVQDVSNENVFRSILKSRYGL